MSTDIGSIQPNPYLYKIESRRNIRARLAHEAGAGAKCRKCKGKCPGFELHFWRKICQNCRCGKDDHEIEEDEDIGRIVIGKLFDRPIRTQEEEEEYSYGTNLEIVNTATGKKEEFVFDWVPPGAAKDLVTRYMEMLPPEKRPITGSEAAKKRRKQLEQQLPLYDMDENERCENMPPEEGKNFQKYLAVLRTKVAGQASIQEVLALQSKQDAIPLDTPGNYASNNNDPASIHSSLGAIVEPPFLGDIESVHNNNLPNIINNAACWQGIETLKQLPSSSLKRQTSGSVKDISKSLSELSHSQKDQSLNESLTPNTNTDEHAVTIHPYIHQFEPVPNPSNEVEFSQNYSTNPQRSRNIPGQKLLPSSQMSPYKNIDSHSNMENVYANVDIGHAQSLQTGNVSQGKPEKKLPNIQNSQKLITLPSNQEIKLHGNEEGSIIPRDDITPHGPAMQIPYSVQRETIPGSGFYATNSNVHILLPKESEVLKHQYPNELLNEDIAQKAFMCQHCCLPMLPGDVAVLCEKAGSDKFWHPSCFVCTTCDELLADLIYFYKDGKVYCGRHYHEASNIPRCHACDELIFSDTWTRADNFEWHIHHYCCFICDMPLAGNKYIPDNRGYPHCIPCYMAFMAKMCETCEKRISPEETRAEYHGYFYHADPDCFCCYNCKKSLLRNRFKMAKNWLFCTQECMNFCAEDIEKNPNEKEKAT